MTDASTALYRAIRIETHPDLRHPSPWAIPAFPEDKQTQFGFSVTLPASHNWLRVTLWLSDECLSRSQHRAVVSRDMIEIVPEHPEANGKCVYRLKLHQGVNTICIDTVANIEKRGEPAPVWPAERHHFERFTLTAHLLNEY